jgi:hypothetical protein
MRKRLSQIWRSVREWLHRGRNTRRVARARARFWAEVHEGEREAEARLRP